VLETLFSSHLRLAVHGSDDLVGNLGPARHFLAIIVLAGKIVISAAACIGFVYGFSRGTLLELERALRQTLRRSISKNKWRRIVEAVGVAGEDTPNTGRMIDRPEPSLSIHSCQSFLVARQAILVTVY